MDPFLLLGKICLTLAPPPIENPGYAYATGIVAYRIVMKVSRD